MSSNNWLVQPILDHKEVWIIATALIGLILLAIIAWRLMIIRPQSATIAIDPKITEIVNKISAAVQHSVEVSAVVGLVKQIEEDPDALELIKSYPETVRAAAWLHYINLLGSDLQNAQDKLSSIHRTYGGQSMYADQEQMSVDVIREKLDDAITASGMNGLRSV